MAALATFPQWLLANAQRIPNRVALREKEFGIWQSVTWAGFADHVRRFALGLHILGFQRGETIVILGDNRPEWLYAELAAQALGGQSIGIYQDSVVDEVLYILQQTRARFMVVEDQEQVDKLLELWDKLPGAERLIYYDPKGLSHYDMPFLMPFEAVEKLADQAAAGVFEDSLKQGKSEDLAILSTTSGTTGKPKLAMLTHGNLLSMGASLLSVDPLTPTDEFVSFLPLAWIGEQMIALSCGLQAGITINFPEETDTVRGDMREIGPYVMFSPPRIWEDIVSTVQVKIEDGGAFKRWCFNRALETGYQMADRKFQGDRPPLGLEIRYALARALVFEPLKDQLGLRRLRRGYTGGAALGPDVFRFFHAIGVNLKQIYGQTEVSGIAVLHRDPSIKFQTVGTPLPDAEVKIAENGEILLKSPAVFIGYYNNPTATRDALRDGWLYTGDAGYLDSDQHLIVIDRAKDVMTLPDGTKFSPQFIENKLKFSQYVKEAVVFGGGEYPYVTAMINIDMKNAGKWAEKRQIAYTTYTDLSQKPEIYGLVRKQVELANADLPPAARIIRFLLLYKELDADDGELTRTRKVRRNLIAGRYQQLTEALYSTAESVEIDSTITYQDGRTASIQTQVRIEQVTTPQPIPATKTS
jgi:long-chain acyl-CoA synthetase